MILSSARSCSPSGTSTSDYKEKQVFGWAEHEPVGTFGGMHYDGQSNLTNYKQYLSARQLEAEKGDPEEDASAEGPDDMLTVRM